MTNYSDSAGAAPADEARPNWSWLQEKVPHASIAKLDLWLDRQLAELEENFAEFVTPKSRNRELRQEFSKSRSSSA